MALGLLSRRGRRPVISRPDSRCPVEPLESRRLLAAVALVGGPSIGSLSDSPDPVLPGNPITLVANDVSGRSMRVHFYRETNGQPDLQTDADSATPDLLLGSDNIGTDYSLAVPTAGLAPGSYTYYAQGEGLVGIGVDAELVSSNVVQTTNRVNGPPSLTGLSASPDSVLPPNIVRVTPVDLSDPDGPGDIMVVEYYYNGAPLTGVSVGDYHMDMGTAGLPVGPGRVSAMAVDRAGNTSTVVSIPVTILNAPPQVVNFSVTSPEFYDQPVRITISTSDPNAGSDATTEVYRESNGTPGLQTGAGGDFRLTSVPFTVADWTMTEPVAPGTYTYYGYVVDKAGASDVRTLQAAVPPNRPPTLAALQAGTAQNPNLTPPVVVDPSEIVTLTPVGAQDPEGMATSFEFYRETNGVPGLQPGYDEYVIDGDELPPLSVRMPAAPRTTTFYAMAVDPGGLYSAPAAIDVTVANKVPAIGTLLVDPRLAQPGDTVRLSATDIRDGNGIADVRAVSFYRESNGVPGLQVGGDAGLGIDTTPADDFFFNLPASGLPGGPNTFYATAIDAAGAVSAPASATNQVAAPPIIQSLQDSPDPVAPGGSITLTAVGAYDPNGDAFTVWFYRESNGTPGLQADDGLLGPAGAAGGYALTVAAPALTGTGPERFTYYAVGDDGTSRGNVVSAENLVSNGVAPATVVGRWLGYNNSAFDTSSGVDVSSGALATDKQALLPGEAPAFANVSSYARGINAVGVDVLNLPTGPAPSVADFDFAVAGPGGWVPAPAPTGMTLGSAGAGGAGRVGFTWADGAIKNTWLRVTAKATPATGLAAPDVFVFGNLVGETGDTPGQYRVNALDLGAVKKALNGTAGVTSRVDFNRDGKINALDLGAAKLNLNRTLAAPPSISQAASAATAALVPSPAPVAGLFSTTTVRDDSTTDVLGLTT